MAASPFSVAPMSDLEPPSSPVHIEKSYMTAVEDEETETLMASFRERTSSQPRGKKRTRDDGSAQNGHVVGKIRHLKKEDGEPLWRKDIQYDFLKAIFDNDAKVFTNSYEPEKIRKQCFADLYIDTMSRSSKTSKVLRDKLLSDREAAKAMAMVCLLVNMGRMNTTLNFFPEMRAQLRTYHAIPSLQAHQDVHAYKQLQDAPRLKSILKGGAEDRPEPSSLEEIKSRLVPRTNPVNLIFVICQAAGKIAELHFPPGREFHDLIMKTHYTSSSRARAFLWVMWFYLESDFTEEGCDENPFGAGVDYHLDVANQGVPKLEEMTAEEEGRENIDSQEERIFGQQKKTMRAKIIEADQQFMAESQSQNKRGKGRAFPSGDDVVSNSGILPRIRPSKHEAPSDIDSVRSTPPPRFGGRQTGIGSNSRRANPLKHQIVDGSSPGGGQMDKMGIVARKPRPPTAHQLAVERNRSQRINYILDRGIRKSHRKARKQRRADGSLIRALKRLSQVQDPFEDSEDEDSSHFNRQILASGAPNPYIRGYPFKEKGFGGLCQLREEEDDFGEEFASYSAAIRRANRRLSRWEEHDGELGVIQPAKRPRANGYGEDDYMEGELSPSKELVDPAETEDESEMLTRKHGGKGKHGRTSGRGDADTDANGHTDEADDLDDVDKGLLGLDEGDGDEDEEELDDVDKTLLGMDGDSDSD